MSEAWIVAGERSSTPALCGKNVQLNWLESFEDSLNYSSTALLHIDREIAYHESCLGSQ